MTKLSLSDVNPNLFELFISVHLSLYVICIANVDINGAIDSASLAHKMAKPCASDAESIASALMALLTVDNLIQSFNDMRKFIRADTADLFSYALSRQRTNLADFYPRLLWEL